VAKSLQQRWRGPQGRRRTTKRKSSRKPKRYGSQAQERHGTISVINGRCPATGPRSRRNLVAEFARRDVDPLSIGSSVVLYFNSVRASARIVAGAIIDSGDDGYASLDEHDNDMDDDDDLAFQFDGDAGSRRTSARSRKGDERLRVTFQFIATREYVETGPRCSSCRRRARRRLRRLQSGGEGVAVCRVSSGAS